MAGKTVVILGAGTGGLIAAHRLRRALDKQHRIVLVDQTPFYSFPNSFTRIMVGRRSSGQASRDIRRLEKKGIEVAIAGVTKIDPDNKRVLLSTGQRSYDYLIIALGAQFSAEEVPGLNRAWTFYHLDGAEGLRDELASFESGRIAVVVSRFPYACPTAPFEGAFLIEEYLRKRKKRDGADIHIYTPEKDPFEAAGPEISERIRAHLAEREIGFSGGATIKSVNHQKGVLNFEAVEDEAAPSEEFDMLVATPVYRVPDVLIESGFAVEGGWVPTERETMITNFEDVYCIGDAARIETPSGRHLPKTGVFAHGEAEVVSRNITAEITGGQPIWAFGGQGAWFMETGSGSAAYIKGDFFAEPAFEVEMRGPNWFWSVAKSGFERIWMWRWF